MPYNALKSDLIDKRNIINDFNNNTVVGYINKVVNSEDTSVDVSSNIQFTAEAGENILGGNAVTMLNGLVYKASNLLSAGKLPIGILKTSVNINEIATIVTKGNITTSLTLNETTDEPIYLRAGTLNLSQNLLTATSVDEDCIIRVGYPITETTFKIDISSPIQILD
jgi:hypothetical protein